MNRRVVIVLLVAVGVGVGGAVAVQVFQSLSRAGAIVVTYGYAVEVQHAFRSGDSDRAMEHVWVGGDVSPEKARPGVTLVAALTRLDYALDQRFGEGFDETPFPPIEQDDMTGRGLGDDVALVGPPDHPLRLMHRAGRWWVAPGPFVDDSISLAQAEAMHAELVRLAKRVDAGEFATRQEALDAYNAAVLLGALRSIAPPVTRPGEN